VRFKSDRAIPGLSHIVVFSILMGQLFCQKASFENPRITQWISRDCFCNLYWFPLFSVSLGLCCILVFRAFCGPRYMTIQSGSIKPFQQFHRFEYCCSDMFRIVCRYTQDFHQRYCILSEFREWIDFDAPWPSCRPISFISPECENAAAHWFGYVNQILFAISNPFALLLFHFLFHFIVRWNVFLNLLPTFSVVTANLFWVAKWPSYTARWPRYKRRSCYSLPFLLRLNQKSFVILHSVWLSSRNQSTCDKSFCEDSILDSTC
jgi:hypothetical protein